MMRRSRRGSLELSVNAIVVLVLAITMLGLGIAFTKGKFAELGSKIEIPEPDFPATEDQPIVLATNDITASTTKDTIFTIKVYNDGSIKNGVVQPSVTCIFNDATKNSVDSQPAISQTVRAGEDEAFKILFTADSLSGLSGKKGICTIVVHQDATDSTSDIYATKQFNIIVH